MPHDLEKKKQGLNVALSSPPKGRLCLSAIPETGMLITNMDLDLTVDCNMRCTYCFKEKQQEIMPDRVAFDAIVWLLHASGDAEQLYVNFMGGEPLLRFELIKKLVPFGKRRAFQHGKQLQFGVTTNCTLVTDEVVAFWRRWGMGFHTSVDGIPVVQNQNRPLASGAPSSPFVEEAVPKILGYRSNTTARCTVVPENVALLCENYLYFRTLGYTNIAMVPSDGKDWNEDSIQEFEYQFFLIADRLIDEMRRGVFINLKGIDNYLKSPKREKRQRFQCGAGRGTVLVDVDGNLWPCHRWNRESEGNWKIGNIYENFNESSRQILEKGCPDHLIQEQCDHCLAVDFCSGGCPAENLETHGSPFVNVSNKCELVKAWALVGRYVHDTLYGEKCPAFMERYYPDEWKQMNQSTASP